MAPAVRFDLQPAHKRLFQRYKRTRAVSRVIRAITTGQTALA